MACKVTLRILVVFAAVAAAGAVVLLGGRGRDSWRDALCALAWPADPPAETVSTAGDLEPPAEDAPDFLPQMRRKLALLAAELEAARRSGGIEYRPAVADSPGAETGPFSHAYAYFGRACDGLWRLGWMTDEEEAWQVRSDVVRSYRAVLKVLEVAAARAEAPPDIAESERSPHDTTVAPGALEGQTETAAAGS